jgi:hypothetical protein
MRVLVVAREQKTGERTRAVNALLALVRTIDLGIDARVPLTAGQISTIAAWRDRDEDATTATCRHEAVRLARRIRTLDADLASNRSDITELIEQDTPQLLELTGVGAVVAASVLIAWSHPGRVRSDAALASLAGTCPIPASSGNTVRHRLNRGGDRRLNRVLTTITIVRMRVDPATRAYVARRRAEGRTTKEIMRSLKRYITRQLFRTLAAAHPVGSIARTVFSGVPIGSIASSSVKQRWTFSSRRGLLVALRKRRRIGGASGCGVLPCRCRRRLCVGPSSLSPVDAWVSAMRCSAVLSWRCPGTG